MGPFRRRSRRSWGFRRARQEMERPVVVEQTPGRPPPHRGGSGAGRVRNHRDAVRIREFSTTAGAANFVIFLENSGDNLWQFIRKNARERTCHFGKRRRKSRRCMRYAKM